MLGRSRPAPPHRAACQESASLDRQQRAGGSQGHDSPYCHPADWAGAGPEAGGPLVPRPGWRICKHEVWSTRPCTQGTCRTHSLSRAGQLRAWATSSPTPPMFPHLGSGRNAVGVAPSARGCQEGGALPAVPVPSLLPDGLTRGCCPSPVRGPCCHCCRAAGSGPAVSWDRPWGQPEGHACSEMGTGTPSAAAPEPGGTAGSPCSSRTPLRVTCLLHPSPAAPTEGPQSQARASS